MCSYADGDLATDCPVARDHVLPPGVHKETGYIYEQGPAKTSENEPTLFERKRKTRAESKTEQRNQRTKEEHDPRELEVERIKELLRDDIS